MVECDVEREVECLGVGRSVQWSVRWSVRWSGKWSERWCVG